MSYDQKFWLALELSLVSEILAILTLNWFIKLEKRPLNLIFAGFIATFSSIVYLWYLLPNYLTGVEYLIVGETLVMLYEMLLYKKILGIKWWQALVLSLVANVVSFSLGWFVF